MENKIEINHLIAQSTNIQSKKMDEIISVMKTSSDLLKEILSVQREMLTFFVSLERRESGLDDTNSQEYLTELKKDGFNPNSD